MASEGDLPEGRTHLQRLRNAIARHVDDANAHPREFHAVVRGHLGSDPDVQAILDGLRRGAAEQVPR